MYPTWIRSYIIRVLSVSVPNIKIPESVSEKICICTIHIRYPTGIPDPFSLLHVSRTGSGQAGSGDLVDVSQFSLHRSVTYQRSVVVHSYCRVVIRCGEGERGGFMKQLVQTIRRRSANCIDSSCFCSYVSMTTSSSFLIHTSRLLVRCDGSQQWPRKLSTKKISNFFIDCLRSSHNIFYLTN
jgi:hypothetical protein